jgi:hypothetical protein
VESVRAEVTFLGELAGRWGQLAAVGVGSFGVAELFARHLAIALPCLIAALVLVRRLRARP